VEVTRHSIVNGRDDRDAATADGGDAPGINDGPFFVDRDWVYVRAFGNTYRFDARTAPVVP
jgi:hypothetical protein